MEKRTSGNLESRRKEYLDERKSLVELESRTADSFVKTMTTLSAGALGLSFAFVEKLAPRPPAHTDYIGGAWVAFGLSLGLILVGHLTSQRSMQSQRRIIGQDWADLESRDSGSGDGSTTKPTPLNNRWAPATTVLDALALVAFIFGMILLGVFTWVNLGRA